MTTNPLVRHRTGVVVAVIALLFSLLVVGAILFSEPLVRWFVEQKGSEATGRSLRIDGALNIDWRWGNAIVQAKNLRMSNAKDYREPDMVTIEQLNFTIKPWPLLAGRFELGQVLIEKPVIILEQKSEDEVNWRLISAEEKTPEPDSHESFLSRINLHDKLKIKNGRVVYRNAVRKLNLDLRLDTVAAENSEVDHKNDPFEFSLSGSGKLQNHPVKLKAFFGSLDALRNPAMSFPVRFKVDMKETRVEIDGVLKDPLNFSDVDTQLNIKGTNLADIYYLTAIPLPPTPPYTLKGRLTKNGGVWGYANFVGEVGESDLSGNLSYDVTGSRGFLQADLTSNVLDSEDLGGFIGLPPSLDTENVTEEQKQAALEKEASARLIPDVPLNVERLRTTDLDVMLTAKKIEAPNLPFKGMTVNFKLKNGVLRLEPFEAILADGKVDGVVEVDARTDIPPMKIQLNLRNLSLNRFFENTRFAATTKGLLGGKLSLSGKGQSLADVLGTSDGDIALIVSGGQISLLLVEASDVDLGEALPLFLGKDKSTRIRCGVADFDVNNGQLSSKTFVLDTEDSMLVGDIGINLQDEKINARLDAKPKDGSILSARIPITLSGSLKSPVVGLDSEKTAVRGATAIALGALLNPFAALLVFVDSGDTKNSDCSALINEVEQF